MLDDEDRSAKEKYTTGGCNTSLSSNSVGLANAGDGGFGVRYTSNPDSGSTSHPESVSSSKTSMAPVSKPATSTMIEGDAVREPTSEILSAEAMRAAALLLRRQEEVWRNVWVQRDMDEAKQQQQQQQQNYHQSMHHTQHQTQQPLNMPLLVHDSQHTALQNSDMPGQGGIAERMYQQQSFALVNPNPQSISPYPIDSTPLPPPAAFLFSLTGSTLGHPTSTTTSLQPEASCQLTFVNPFAAEKSSTEKVRNGTSNARSSSDKDFSLSPAMAVNDNDTGPQQKTGTSPPNKHARLVQMQGTEQVSCKEKLAPVESCERSAPASAIAMPRKRATKPRASKAPAVARRTAARTRTPKVKATSAAEARSATDAGKELLISGSTSMEGAQAAVKNFMHQQQEWPTVDTVSAIDQQEQLRAQQELEHILRQDMAMKMHAVPVSWPQQQTQLSAESLDAGPWFSSEMLAPTNTWPIPIVTTTCNQGKIMSQTTDADGHCRIGEGDATQLTLKNDALPRVIPTGLPVMNSDRRQAPLQDEAFTQTVASYKAAEQLNHTMLSRTAMSDVCATPQSHLPSQYGTVQMGEPVSGDTHGTCFLLAREPQTGEHEWIMDRRSSKDDDRRLLEYNAKFPVRPLLNGDLAQLHNDWLDNHSAPPASEGQQLNQQDARGGTHSPAAYHPNVEPTLESLHVRLLWQELERRRVLQLNDPVLISRLRHEAINELCREAAQGASNSNISFGNGLNPSEHEVENRMRCNWERCRSSAAYTVGLLRQAEYCVAQALLGFQPLVQQQESISAPQGVHNYARQAGGLDDVGQLLPGQDQFSTEEFGRSEGGLITPRNTPQEQKRSSDGWDEAMMKRLQAHSLQALLQ